MSHAFTVQDGHLSSASAGIGEALSLCRASPSGSSGLPHSTVVSGKSEFIQQPASPRTKEAIGSYQVAATVSYESKLSPRASPDSRGGDNTRATLWKGASLETNPLLPRKLLLLCHWPELCDRSTLQPITVKDVGFGRIDHHIQGCPTIRGHHHCSMNSTFL